MLEENSMYTSNEFRDVEDICYEEEHVQKVINSIRSNFDKYFTGYINSHAGKGVSPESFAELQKKFRVSIDQKKLEKTRADNYATILREAVIEFEKDREAYQDILREELLDDYDEDATTFKSKVLKNDCPIIRKTLNSDAEELKKYKKDFRLADPDELLNVVTNLCAFSDEYADNYDPETYEEAAKYQDLKLELLDTEDYTAYGVIGGGIKTHILYKAHPGLFPNRSRGAIWALWYLTNKEKFGCKTDSEFIMIDVKRSFTQQNYFYPYQLFAYYAFEIYKMLRDKALEYGIGIDTAYRYVAVDSFLNYIADAHASEIQFFKIKGEDGGYGFA